MNFKGKDCIGQVLQHIAGMDKYAKKIPTQCVPGSFFSTHAQSLGTKLSMLMIGTSHYFLRSCVTLRR